MFSSLLAKFKESKPMDVEKTKLTEKSSSVEVFLKSAETKHFVQEWSRKKDKRGARLYTKRGVTSLLHILHSIPGLTTDKKVLKKADGLLKELKGADGLQGFLRGLKAKTEGIMKGGKVLPFKKAGGKVLPFKKPKKTETKTFEKAA